MARSHHHHHLKLLEINLAVAVAIDAADHPPALRHRAVVAEALHHLLQLLRRDRPVAVDVEHRERVLQILQRLHGIDPLGVELDELL